MTFPVIASTGTSSPSGTTPLVVTLPASIAAGDLLLGFIELNSSVAITTPAGWHDLLNAGDGTYVFYKYASGSEGASVSITTGGGSHNAAAVVYRITGTDGATAPAIAQTAVTTSSTFDPPSLSPSWGSADTLWLACAMELSTRTVSTAPTSYSLQNSQPTSPVGDTAIIYTRTNTTATENPSAYTLSGTATGYAITVGVPPAVAANSSAFLQMFR